MRRVALLPFLLAGLGATSGCGSGRGSAIPSAKSVVTPGPNEPKPPVAKLDPAACCKDSTCDRRAFRREGGVCPDDLKRMTAEPVVVGGTISRAR